MTIGEFIARLDSVRPTGRGWVAKCPSHDDRHPSLSIKHGDDGRILLHDFGGCRTADILAQLNLRLADLFPDSAIDPRQRQEHTQRDQERANRARASHVTGLLSDARREAEALIARAKGIDISHWTPTQLDSALHRLADAYALLQQEDSLYERA